MKITHQVQIARPAAEVFAYVTDYANDVAWREGVLEMTAHGSKTYERLTFLGSTYVTEGVITEKTERRLSFKGASDTVDSNGYREVTETRDGALFTYELELRPRGLLRLFAPLLRYLYARRIRRDLGKLRELLASPEKQRRYDQFSRQIA